MADETASSEDRTEDATPERRDEFRGRGEVVVSRELTSVFILGSCVVAFTSGAPKLLKSLQKLLIASFESLATRRIDNDNFSAYLSDIWLNLLQMIIPIFMITSVAAISLTLLQTKLNWSWERLSPDLSKLDPFSGIARMFTFQTVLELLKNIAKLIAVATVGYLILRSEWVHVPELMNYPMTATWSYWGKITRQLFWSVSGFLVVISGLDYLWNFFSNERKMRMTKQEVKEDYKRREVDQNVKAKMRRMQRDFAARKTIATTRTATVLITNPTHYSIALRYNIGDRAPVLLAKGVDFLALNMREAAKEEQIPIIENRPLARALYATVNEGEEIPDKFYKAVAEIIRYVYRLKGRAIPKKRVVDANSN